MKNARMSRIFYSDLLARALVVGGALVVSGCGPAEQQLVPVRGELYFEGKPAAGAFVLLTPAGAAKDDKWPNGYPRSSVNSDGTFEVGTKASNDGAPAGDYKVTATWLVAPPGANSDDPEAATMDRFHGKFRDPVKSQLTATVVAPQTSLPRIDLK